MGSNHMFSKQLLYVGRNHRFFLSNLEDDPSTSLKTKKDSKTKKTSQSGRNLRALVAGQENNGCETIWGDDAKKNDRNQVQIQDKSR